ncbi:helix-turn-helix transcriptional regulator [Haladaptatus sp. NG-WS-4]
MNRRRIDFVVGIFVAAVLVFGGALSWQAYQQKRALGQMGTMMGTSMDSVHGTNPIWYVLGTVLVSAVVGGVYLTVRDDLPAVEMSDQSQNERSSSGSEEADEPSNDQPRRDGPIDPEEQPRSHVLDLLPDDERRILEPVLTSPGITQIELRDRSDFSKSKVSQTASALEKRGLLYRERQGRTYRIYPSEDLLQNRE